MDRLRMMWWIVLVVLGMDVGVADAQEVACLLQPSTVVALSSPAEGILETVSVERGALVQEGQVLATLESSLERAAVAVAKAKAEAESALQGTQAKLEFSTRKLIRAEDLSQKQTLSQHELDEAKTERVLAEANRLEARENRRLAELELQRASASLALRTVRSPITGVVVERLLSPGEAVKLTPILKLARVDPLRVDVFVPLVWWGKLFVGMQADVIPEAPISGVYRATVTEVGRVLDAAGGTVAISLELPNPGLRLPAGIKCTARFAMP
ncbi:MAG: efflux RND transporter periplasmic adaptor subunit [Nitrospirota bacterium]|nr:efflux RND transporter periplasmic adaptor subunit [Nitrospirota bacterium]MDE3243360.1 efflux RND transporter periplasmic adaptor subunit [Nitrospirota bacterium]